MRSYKTTIVGLLTIIATLCTVAVAALNGQHVDFGATATGIGAGIGLLFARDHTATGDNSGGASGGGGTN